MITLFLDRSNSDGWSRSQAAHGVPVLSPVLTVQDNRRPWNMRSRGYRARALQGISPG